MSATEGRSRKPVAYLVLPDASEPFLLARVRWPDVYQAISPVRPYWQDDPGLFDLPYAPTSTAVTYEEAAEIAAEWGARLPAEDEEKATGPSLIRRMPSDWSHLSTAERRAWSIEIEKRARPQLADPAPVDLPAERERQVPAPVSRRRRWARRRVEPVMAEGSALQEDPSPDDTLEETLVIDLTDATESARLTADYV